MQCTICSSLLPTVVLGTAKAQAVEQTKGEVSLKGWTIVSMKDDWQTIFPPEKK